MGNKLPIVTPFQLSQTLRCKEILTGFIFAFIMDSTSHQKLWYDGPKAAYGLESAFQTRTHKNIYKIYTYETALGSRAWTFKCKLMTNWSNTASLHLKIRQSTLKSSIFYFSVPYIDEHSCDNLDLIRKSSHNSGDTEFKQQISKLVRPTFRSQFLLCKLHIGIATKAGDQSRLKKFSEDILLE